MILGVGVDLTDLARMRRALERTGEGLERRLFTPLEIAYCRARRDPIPSFSARFAAKEAMIKALGVGWQEGMRWVDIEVVRHPNGAPHLVIHGATRRECDARGVASMHLSLTHGEAQAVAMVVLEG